MLYYYKYLRNPVLIEQCLKDFFAVVCGSYSHERVELLVHRIFQVSDVAVSDHINLIQKLKGKPIPQIAWVWESFGKEYLNKEEYLLSNESYWNALDRYVKIADSTDDSLIEFTFYDGKPELYISDLIYRIYGNTYKGELWEEDEKAFEKRKKALAGYQYFYMYYAAILYNCVHQEENLKKQSSKLKKTLGYLDKISDDGKTEDAFEVKCAALFDLGRYKEVIECCKIAVSKYPDSADLGRTRSFAFQSDIVLLYVCCWHNLKSKAVEALEDGAAHLECIPVSAMDSAKMYIPIFKFYKKCCSKVKNISEACMLFMKLLNQVNVLRKSLEFYNDGKQLGYYTTLPSVYYMLADEVEKTKYRLTIFDARHMNDPNEGQVLEQYFNSGIMQSVKTDTCTQKRQSYRNSFTFLKSFTTKIDSLPMWVQYAKDGQGCLVIIDPEMFADGDRIVKSKKNSFLNELFIEDDYHLYNVAYFDGNEFTTSDGKAVTEDVNAVRTIYKEILCWWDKEDNKADIEGEFFQTLDSILSRIKFLVKRNDYDNEDEVRVMFFRTGSEADIEQTGAVDGGFPRIYIRLKVETQIKEIVLGPKVKNGYDVVPYIYKQLRKMHREDVQITQSEIEYV